jgi:hypothetical protein
MILVFSSKSNASPHIPKEIERAVSAGVAVIPFRIEDVLPGKSLDYFIGSVHWLDALTRPLEQHIERLVQNVQTLLSRDAPVIEARKSSVIAAPSSIRPSSVRLPWLYAALGVMAVLVIVFAVLLFARKPSKSAQIAPAPVSSHLLLPANRLQRLHPNRAEYQAQAAATPWRQEEIKTGGPDTARVPVPPETPAAHAAAPSTSAGDLFDQGLSAYRDKRFSQAAELYRKACDGGERKGCNDLGLMYYCGEGMAKDLNRAAGLFKRACDAGGTGGCLDLGLMYLRGEGVPEDLDRAANLYKRACDAGAPPGCTDLGRMYHDGKGAVKDLNRAADLFKKACEAGVSRGCEDLATLK